MLARFPTGARSSCVCTVFPWRFLLVTAVYEMPKRRVLGGTRGSTALGPLIDHAESVIGVTGQSMIGALPSTMWEEIDYPPGGEARLLQALEHKKPRPRTPHSSRPHAVDAPHC
jgi:hypothetical protein